MNCDSLSVFNLMGSKITYIGKNAFADCDNMEAFYLNSSVTGIGENAFKDCEKLKTVYDLSTSLKIEKGSTSNGCLGYYAENVYTSL